VPAKIKTVTARTIEFANNTLELVSHISPDVTKKPHVLTFKIENKNGAAACTIDEHIADVIIHHLVEYKKLCRESREKSQQ
jgi:hypothetical protein